jgi:hypothetical protein
MKTTDGPASPHFTPVQWQIESAGDLSQVSEAMQKLFAKAPQGEHVTWGIPFSITKPIVLSDRPVEIPIRPLKARWLVFLHTSDMRPVENNSAGFISPMHGEGMLNEHAATYSLLYAGGGEERAEIRRRHHIGMYDHRWGERTFQSVPAPKPSPVRQHHEQPSTFRYWGLTQTRIREELEAVWLNYLWAWENPHPEAEITALRFEPVCGATMVFGVSAGDVLEQPLRWQPRQKAVLTLPADVAFQPDLDENGLLAQVQLDLGQVISAQPVKVYPNGNWEETYNNQLPQIDDHRIAIEYTAHPAACFHLWDGSVIPAADVEGGKSELALQFVPPARQRVTLRVVAEGSGRPVPVKLHLHGESGEYLAPTDRHRIPNPAWFEDYSVDFVHRWNYPAPTWTARPPSTCRWARCMSRSPRDSRCGPSAQCWTSDPIQRRSRSSWSGCCRGANAAG